MRSFLLFVVSAFAAIQVTYAQVNSEFNHLVDPNVPWAYDAGPNLKIPMGRELVDLVAAYPFMPEVSEQLLGEQKFRIHFGPTNWRMRHVQNSSKILFIGQDATHIAEAAKRTATAGFGGRAQDLAAYFGVDESASFINAYQNTIRGQYGVFNTPYILMGKNNRPQVRSGSYIDAGLWLMTQDLGSPMVQWRNQFLDWFLRSHRSLKLIVLFGSAARDSAGAFIESKGGKVGTYFSEEQMAQIQVPLIKEEYAGANNTYPSVLTRSGKDLAEELLGRRVDYKNLEDQKAVQDILKSRVQDFLDKAAFTEGGPYANGLLHPAQLGGYKLDKITINGVNTISLKGLKLSDGSTVGDVLVAQFPHPSSLSRMSKADASATMQRTLEGLKDYVDRGWIIPADPGMVNKFAAGKEYEYSRTPIGPEYYDFGTPGTRMLDVSLASRMSGRPDVIVLGTRDRVKFDMKQIDAAAEAVPGTKVDSGNIFATQARVPSEKNAFDPGPGEAYAKIMKENLDLKKIFATKPGKSWKTEGIDAYYVKSHPDLGDFGHYRGTFDRPQVIILADPHGYDDINTARALTGARGQYLQSLLNSMGVTEQYLIIKTVPFGMDGATDAEWKKVLEDTNAYREKLIAEVLKQNKPLLILSDGKYATAEILRIVKSRSVPVIDIQRPTSAADADLDDESLIENIAHIDEFMDVKFNGEMANIPRSHLPYGTRAWEGTSGDRVFNAADKNKGLAFAFVAPKWAWQQNVKLSAKTKVAVDKLKNQLYEAGLPYPNESVSSYFDRKKAGKAQNQSLPRAFKIAN